MITAKIIADSIDPRGNRLTTFVVTFPRIILAEFNTHRMFSRNSASSRAIPFEKMVESVKTNPFIPIAWQKDHKGMQGTEYITDLEEIENCKTYWFECRDWAINGAEGLNKLESVTKQLCNRLLEPFMWHTVIVTATEFENFFELRCPKYEDEIGKQYRSKKDFYYQILDPTQGWMEDINSKEWFEINKGQSEIHMMALAEVMWDTYNESKPKELKEGEWHIPFGDNINVRQVANLIPHYQETNGEIRVDNNIEQAFVKIATARCARVSYTVVGEDKESSYENDIKLYDRLLESKHLSPFEHCARVMTDDEYKQFGKSHLYDSNIEGCGYVADYLHEDIYLCFQQGWCNNFKGFIQQRYLVENE